MTHRFQIFNRAEMLDEGSKLHLELDDTRLHALEQLGIIPCLSRRADGEDAEYPLTAIVQLLDAVDPRKQNEFERLRRRGALLQAAISGDVHALGPAHRELQAALADRFVLGELHRMLPVLEWAALETLRGDARAEWRIRQATAEIAALITSDKFRDDAMTPMRAVPSVGALAVSSPSADVPAQPARRLDFTGSQLAVSSPRTALGAEPVLANGSASGDFRGQSGRPDASLATGRSTLRPDEPTQAVPQPPSTVPRHVDRPNAEDAAKHPEAPRSSEAPVRMPRLRSDRDLEPHRTTGMFSFDASDMDDWFEQPAATPVPAGPSEDVNRTFHGPGTARPGTGETSDLGRPRGRAAPPRIVSPTAAVDVAARARQIAAEPAAPAAPAPQPAENSDRTQPSPGSAAQASRKTNTAAVPAPPAETASGTAPPPAETASGTANLAEAESPAPPTSDLPHTPSGAVAKAAAAILAAPAAYVPTSETASSEFAADIAAADAALETGKSVQGPPPRFPRNYQSPFDTANGGSRSVSGDSPFVSRNVARVVDDEDDLFFSAPNPRSSGSSPIGSGASSASRPIAGRPGTSGAAIATSGASKAEESGPIRVKIPLAPRADTEDSPAVREEAFARAEQAMRDATARNRPTVDAPALPMTVGRPRTEPIAIATGRSRPQVAHDDAHDVAAAAIHPHTAAAHAPLPAPVVRAGTQKLGSIGETPITEIPTRPNPPAAKTALLGAVAPLTDAELANHTESDAHRARTVAAPRAPKVDDGSPTRDPSILLERAAKKLDDPKRLESALADLLVLLGTEDREVGQAAWDLLHPVLRKGNRYDDMLGALMLMAEREQRPGQRVEWLLDAASVAEENVGDMRQAFDLLCDVVRSQPQHEAAFERSQVLAAAHGWTLPWLSAVADALGTCDRDRAEVLVAAAEESARAGDQETALVRVYEAFVFKHGATPRMLRVLTDSYEAQGRNDDLVRLLVRHAEREVGENRTEAFARAADLAQAQLGDVDQALRIYERALAATPNDESLRNRYIHTAQVVRRTERAMEFLGRNESDDPVQGLLDRAGVAATRFADAEREITYMRQAFAIDSPRRCEVGFMLVEKFDAEAKIAESVDVLRTMMRSAPNNTVFVQIARMLAERLLKLDPSGRQSLAVYDEVFGAGVSDPQLVDEFTEFLEDRGDYAYLIEVYSICAQRATLPEERVEYFRRIARVATEHIEEDEAAIALLEESVDATDGDAVVLLRLAERCGKSGDVLSEMGALDRILASDSPLRLSPEHMLRLAELQMSRPRGASRAAEIVEKLLDFQHLGSEVTERLSKTLPYVAHESGRFDLEIRWLRSRVSRAASPNEAVVLWMLILDRQEKYNTPPAERLDSIDAALEAAGAARANDTDLAKLHLMAARIKAAAGKWTEANQHAAIAAELYAAKQPAGARTFEALTLLAELAPNVPDPDSSLDILRVSAESGDVRFLELYATTCIRLERWAEAVIPIEMVRESVDDPEILARINASHDLVRQRLGR